MSASPVPASFRVPALRFFARAGYVGIILLATLSGLEADPSAADLSQRLTRALSPTLGARDVVDGLRNLLLFAGWGATWYLTAPPVDSRRSILYALLSGAALSLLVEGFQLFNAGRTPSPLDLLTNSAGALGGALALARLENAIRGARGRRSFVGVPAGLFAGSYLGAAALEVLVPLFRQQRLPVSGGPLQRLEFALDWLRRNPGLDLPWLDLPLFLPAGAFAVAWLAERGTGYRAALIRVVLGGAVAAALLEIVGGATGQPIEPGAALIHAAAVALGAWAACAWLPRLTVQLRGRARPGALLAAYAFVVALWSWRPFLPKHVSQFAGQLVFDRFVPLYALGGRVDLFSVSDVAIQFLLLLPVGGLLAVWPLRARGKWSGFLPALYLAVFVELGQVLVAQRFFDVTDLIVQTAGAAVGWALVRRAGFREYGEIGIPTQERLLAEREPARGAR